MKGPAPIPWTAIAVIILSAASPRAQSPPESIVTSVRVVDQTTGGDVAGLTAADFDLRIDSVPTPIRSVEENRGPLRLAVLIDVSRSDDVIESGEGAMLPLALDRAVFAALTPGDQVQIGGLSSRMWLSPWLRDRAALVDAVATALRRPEIERYGPSPLWDQIDDVVNDLGGQPGNRIVLVISDGRGTGNRLSVGTVALHASVANVTVCAIGEATTSTIIQDETTIVRVNADAGLRSLVDTSGGMFVPGVLTVPRFSAAARSFDPTALLTRLVDAMRHRYVLTFSAIGQELSPHTIEVRMKDERYRATTRRLFREGRTGS